MNIHAISITDPSRIAQQMKELDVYDDGVRIMTPKAVNMVAKLEGISSIAANILKQEMLSLSGEVAVSKGVITGKEKNAICLIMGNLSQYNRLIDKLKKQPFGLDKIAYSIEELTDDYFAKSHTVKAGKFTLKTGRRTLVMGIVNITPDSFSGDGLCKSEFSLSDIEEKIIRMIKDGADIIDIGGQSTRPGASSVSTKEELRRVIPIIKKVAKKINVPISIDTCKLEVAKRALSAGASIVNNIMGIRKDKEFARIVKRNKAAMVIMHIKGTPKTMQKNPAYDSLITEIFSTLRNSMNFFIEQGVERESLIVDPGIGFGKTVEHNIEIIQRLRELKSLGRPILIGPSRKSFIGKILKVDTDKRLLGTAASISCSIQNGADIIRVHDVKEMVQIAKITDSFKNYN